MTRLRTAALAALLGVATTGCTNGQIGEWLAWWQTDPAAAEQFAQQPEIQQALADRGTRQVAASNSGGGTVWDRLAQCESGGNWHIATGNGYYGGLQFLPSTWRANGGTGMPHEHSREEQIRVAENLRATSGFAPWPACSRKLGLR